MLRNFLAALLRHPVRTARCLHPFGWAPRKEISCQTGAESAPAVSPKLFFALVGDSWLADMDDGIRHSLYAAQGDAIVRSVSVRGATSTEISPHLLDARDGQIAYAKSNYPDRRLIVVIEGGINDAFGYHGPGPYVREFSRMVRISIECHAFPVVLTIPFFDRSRVSPNLPRDTMRMIHRMLSGDEIGDNAAIYNQLLRRTLDPYLESRQAALIDLRALVPIETIKVRYVDQAHLSAVGFDELGHAVGAQVAELAMSH